MCKQVGRYRCARWCAAPNLPNVVPIRARAGAQGPCYLAARRRVSRSASTSLSTARRSATGSASTFFSRLRSRAVFGDVPWREPRSRDGVLTSRFDGCVRRCPSTQLLDAFRLDVFRVVSGVGQG